MPANKYALLRYRIIDRTIGNRNYPTKEDLRYACEEALYGSDGEHISMSTIDKDLWAMRNESELAYYAPIKFSKQYGGYYYEDPDYTIAELPLTEDDLNAIKSAAETLFQFKDIALFKDFDTAIEKILDRMKISASDEHKTEHDVLQFDRGEEYQGSEYLTPLFEAAKADMKVVFEYRKFGSDTVQKVELDPYLLKEYRNRWYVIGYEEAKNGMRTYSLDRIEALVIVERSFDRIKGFDTKSFFKHAMGITVTNEKPSVVQLKFSGALIPYITSQPLHATQKTIRHNENELIIELNILITVEFISTILGFGEQVEVVSPASLRQEVKRALTNCLKKYETAS